MKASCSAWIRAHAALTRPGWRPLSALLASWREIGTPNPTIAAGWGLKVVPLAAVLRKD